MVNPVAGDTGEPTGAGRRRRESAVEGGAGRALSIWTIGHSTRPIEEFIDLLREFEIGVLVDVRHYPGSRRYPHFHKEALRGALGAAGIRYEHLVELGGRRPARPDSHNLAWRNASFRGYADYMETEPFRAGVERLLDIARTDRTAIMCSEAVWWRCHRSMIADYLKAMGVEVLHILSRSKVQEHPYTSAAQIVDGRLSYASPESAPRVRAAKRAKAPEGKKEENLFGEPPRD